MRAVNNEPAQMGKYQFTIDPIPECYAPCWSFGRSVHSRKVWKRKYARAFIQLASALLLRRPE